MRYHYNLSIYTLNKLVSIRISLGLRLIEVSLSLYYIIIIIIIITLNCNYKLGRIYKLNYI